MIPKFKVLDKHEVLGLFKNDEKRLMGEIDAAFGKKIDALSLSEADKRDIRENIAKIVGISRQYISGVEQRLLHPANYNTQDSDGMREEIINQFGGRNWLRELGIETGSSKSAGMYRDGIINAILDGPSPRDDIISYVGTIYLAASLYDGKIENAVQAGMRWRGEAKTSFPAVFENRPTIWIRVPQMHANLARTQDLFAEIAGAVDGVEISVGNEAGSYRLNYKFAGDEKSKSERLVAFLQKAVEILSAGLPVDFSDAEFIKLFLHEPRGLLAIAGLKELKRRRGETKNPQNKWILNVFSNNPLLLLHIGVEIRNHADFSPDMTPETFKAMFESAVDDLAGKYKSFSASIGAAVLKNEIDSGAEAIDLLAFSIDPHQIAVQSTYQDWQSCMHALSGNFHHIEHDIALGTIICYGCCSNDPAHKLVRCSLKPCVNDIGDVAYRFSKEYGILFDGFRKIVTDAFKSITGAREPFGMYRLRPGLYADGMSKVLVLDEDSDDEWRKAYGLKYVPFKKMPPRLIDYDFAKSAIENDPQMRISMVPERILDEHPDLYSAYLCRQPDFYNVPKKYWTFEAASRHSLKDVLRHYNDKRYDFHISIVKRLLIAFPDLVKKYAHEGLWFTYIPEEIMKKALTRDNVKAIFENNPNKLLRAVASNNETPYYSHVMDAMDAHPDLWAAYLESAPDFMNAPKKYWTADLVRKHAGQRSWRHILPYGYDKDDGLAKILTQLPELIPEYVRSNGLRLIASRNLADIGYDLAKIGMEHSKYNLAHIPENVLKEHPELYGLWLEQAGSDTPLPKFYRHDEEQNRHVAENIAQNAQASVGWHVAENIAQNAQSVRGLNKMAGKIAEAYPDLRGAIRQRYLQLMDAPAAIEDARCAPAPFGWLYCGTDSFNQDIVFKAIHGSIDAAKQIAMQNGSDLGIQIEIYKTHPRLQSLVLQSVSDGAWQNMTKEQADILIDCMNLDDRGDVLALVSKLRCERKLFMGEDVEMRLAKRLAGAGKMTVYDCESIKSEKVLADKQAPDAVMASFYSQEHPRDGKAVSKLINAIPESVRGDLPKKIKGSSLQTAMRCVQGRAGKIPAAIAENIKDKSGQLKTEFAKVKKKLQAKIAGFCEMNIKTGGR
ncbi:MAG: hypothetical protein LBB08_02925 [Rickettsiales bacterium]|jgi:hypothetical protein|nr:hypothetical protein [Rickettsiales bacterium]